MRYGASPQTLLEWIALLTGQVPRPVLDTLVPLVQARALMAAVECGLLDALAAAPVPRDRLAERLRLDPDCLGLLLRVLRAMGYVEPARTGGGEAWALTALGARHFGPGAQVPCADFLRYGPPQWEMIGRLDEVLRTGAGIDFHDAQAPADWERYQRAMLEVARGFAGFVARALPVPRGATRCLDVAGGHGFVAAELCRRHPGLRATVLDRAEALRVARPLAQEGGWADVVSFCEGDLDGALPPGQHVVLLCNILHHLEPLAARRLLARVRDALEPGGVVGIFDVEPPAPDAGPEAAADALALFFRVTSGARCHRGDETAGWLEEAGFASVRAVRSVRLPSRVLVHGQRV